MNKQRFLFISCWLCRTRRGHAQTSPQTQTGLCLLFSPPRSLQLWALLWFTHVLWSTRRNWTLQRLCPSGRCSGSGPSRPWSCSPRRKCQWSAGCSKVSWLSSAPPVRRCPVQNQDETKATTHTETTRLGQSGSTLCVCRTLRWTRACRSLLLCLFVSYNFPSVAEGEKYIYLSPHHTHTHTLTHTHTHKGLYPAVTPHSRQMGDICSLEIFLHYCHRGTSLNVCFPALVLMRTCLLKWWSTWQRTFTWRRARTDHTCDSVLSGGAGRVTSARCTTLARSEQGQFGAATRLSARAGYSARQHPRRRHLYRLRLCCGRLKQE